MVRGIPGGEKFVQLLREMGFSYRRIAREVGVSKSTVRRWAMGETRPRRENYLRLQMLAVRELVGDRSLREAARELGIPRTTLIRHLRGQVVSRDPGRYIASPFMLGKVLGEDMERLFYLDQVPVKTRKHLFTAATKAPETLLRLIQYNLAEYTVDPEKAADYLVRTWMERAGIAPDDETRVKRLVHSLVGEDGEGGILWWAMMVGGSEYYAAILGVFATSETLKEVWEKVREIYRAFEEG